MSSSSQSSEHRVVRPGWVQGLVWLSGFAGAGALVQAAEPGWGGLIGALVWNLILMRTSRLWTTSRLVAALPLVCWIVVYGLLSFVPAASGDILGGVTWLTYATAVTGLIGGLWPVVTMSTTLRPVFSDLGE